MIAFKVGLKASESPVNVLPRGADILPLAWKWLQEQKHCIVCARAAFLHIPQRTGHNPAVPVLYRWM